MANYGKREDTLITLTGAGNQSAKALQRRMRSDNNGVSYQCVAGTLSGSVTVNFEWSLDGANWKPLLDNNTGVQVTFTLTTGTNEIKGFVDIPNGAQVRPLFVSTETGDVTVTSWA